MIYVLLSAVAFAAQNWVSGLYAREYHGKDAALVTLCVLSQAAIALLMIPLGGLVAVPPSSLPLLAACGAAFVVTFLMMVSAMRLGSLGLTSLIVNVSMVMPLLHATLVRGDPLLARQWVGIALIFGMLVLNAQGSLQTGKSGKRWLMYAILAFLGNGLLLILQDILAERYPQVSSCGHTFWTASCATVFSLLLLLALWLGKGRALGFSWVSPRACGLSVLSGAGSAFGNLFIFMALSSVSGAVAFPVRQGAVILILWVVDLLIYHERPDAKRMLMLLCGIAALILLR